MRPLSQLENRLQTDSVQAGSSGPWRPLLCVWGPGGPRQAGILPLQHEAKAGTVPASWRLNLLRGSAAQWWEVGRTHNSARPFAPASPLTETCSLAGPARD
ncbi:Glucosyltransferase-S [Dissostichus eleginoides]|uniref:Glucosyltransferase-S n=1 Tax=Dissostichus eleginoides TaxID=100907 RepID=A0AAD9FKV5_DISEL|nr:Glucosyltransferase-S [Dissostichus eleginoides]